MKSFISLVASFVLFAGLASAADKRPMQVEDLFKACRALGFSPDD